MTMHEKIQTEIVSACRNIGINAIQEYKGQDWRADVYIPNNGKPIAFEIQLSPQSLSRTLERQTKYIRDGVIGCWLFENPVPKLIEERPDLPVFYVQENETSNLIVNLGDRRKIDLQTFLENFIADNIQFKNVAKTKKTQVVNLVFYDMSCWKCGELNNLFFVDSPFYSACNAKIEPDEAIWESNNMEYRPEIIELAQKYVANNKNLNLNLAQIKMRHSKTINRSYMSFGCYKCDSIFGDFFVMEAKLDLMYGPKELAFRGEIELLENIELLIPHWCLPDNSHFCD
jgi:hypothetical protein